MLALQQALDESLAVVLDSHLVATHGVTLVALPEKVAALYSKLASCTVHSAFSLLSPSVLSASLSPTTPTEVAKRLGLPHPGNDAVDDITSAVDNITTPQSPQLGRRSSHTT
jgi:hypothetical protein